MQAVVFDLFGTLVDNFEPCTWNATYGRIGELLGADPSAFLEAWDRTFRSRMDGTLPDDDAVFADTAASLGLRPSPEQFRQATQLRLDAMAAAIKPKEDAIACLDAIRAAGLRLALVTDCSSGTPALLDTTALGPYFEIRAISSHLGVTKPHPTMYEHVLGALDVAGRDCWYVGDGNSEELPGAKRHGMTTVWVDNGDRQHHTERFVPEGDFSVRQLAELPGVLGL